MRKLFFMLAFLLAGSLTFAESTEDYSESLEVNIFCNHSLSTDFQGFHYSEDLILDSTTCRLIYNFVNPDGEIVFTATYRVTLSSGTCQQALALFRADAIDAYNEYMG